VAVIGLKLLADWGFNSDWSFDDQPWAARALGGWKQSFEGLEKSRRRAAENYDKWLEEKWIFKIKPEAAPPPGAPHHPPHLLGFEDVRRPEAIVFWTCMLVAFCTGFIPP